jgi:hypothetical protein
LKTHRADLGGRVIVSRDSGMRHVRSCNRMPVSVIQGYAVGVFDINGVVYQSHGLPKLSPGRERAIHIRILWQSRMKVMGLYYGRT